MVVTRPLSVVSAAGIECAEARDPARNSPRGTGQPTPPWITQPPVNSAKVEKSRSRVTFAPSLTPTGLAGSRSWTARPLSRGALTGCVWRGGGRSGTGKVLCCILQSFYKSEHAIILLETSVASYHSYYKIQTLGVLKHREPCACQFLGQKHSSSSSRSPWQGLPRPPDLKWHLPLPHPLSR